jgi:hypothetical protein
MINHGHWFTTIPVSHYTCLARARLGLLMNMRLVHVQMRTQEYFVVYRPELLAGTNPLKYPSLPRGP